ncbi:MAG: trypsin-like peptidase domain-containing protein [Gemmatimonadales bacterium]
MSIDYRTTARWAGLASLPVVAWLITLAVTPARSHAVPPPPSAAAASLTELSTAFSDIAEGVRPSVVYITTKRNGEAEMTSFEVPPEFRQFFGLPDDGGRRHPTVMTASGSGFVVSQDGYILTNAHVVEGAREVRVRLLDRREFPAKVIGSDPTTDIAVVKIKATGLPAAMLGSSAATRVGEWVLAVGNPFGENLSFTVTQGIVSAKGRALDLPNRSSRSIQDFIQTDAAINPGNSGGPLVDTRGEVIGVNSAIASENGTYSGYGFAVPIDLARKVMDQLIANGRVDRAALGILGRDASAEDATYAGADHIGGVLVQDFPPNSGAEAAGMQRGDLIVGLDGQPIEYIAQLQELVAFRHAGDRVKVEVARKGGRHTTLTVALTRAGEDEAATAPTSADDSANGTEEGSVSGLGVTVEPTTPEVARDLELPANRTGLVVTGVDENGPAAEKLSGPNFGPDIITAVEGQPVRTADQLRKELQAHRGQIVSLDLWNARSRSSRIERIAIPGTGK